MRTRENLKKLTLIDPDGIIKYVISVAAISTGIVNIVGILLKKESLLNTTPLTVGLILIGIMFATFRLNHSIGILMLVIAIYLLLTPGGSGDISSALPLVLALTIYRSKKIGIILLFSTYVIGTIGFVIKGYTGLQILNVMLLYSGLYYCYYKYVFKYMNKVSNIKKLTPEENQLVTFLAFEDVMQKEASELMNHNNQNVTNNVLKKVKKKLGVTTVPSVARLAEEYYSSKNNKQIRQK